MANDSKGTLRRALFFLALLLLPAPGSLEGQGMAPSYLGETAPGAVPVPFAPHILTRELHSSPVFSKDMGEIFWSEMEGEGIHVMRAREGKWSEAQLAPFSLPYSGEPTFGAEGNTLYFLSGHEFEGSQSRYDENLWKVVRERDGWSEPEPLGPVINDHPMHWGVSFAENGNLYFGRRGEPQSIFVSELRDGVYQDPTPLLCGGGGAIEGTTPEVASDESWLVFAKGDGVESETFDLFVIFRTPEGEWTDPAPLDGANTGEMEISPRITPDGLYLFFLRRVAGELRPFWVSSSIIQEAR